MGSRGPAPKPTALRLIQGDHPERINHDEPIPAELEVVCPDGLSDAAQAMWDRYTPDMIAKKVLTAWDADTFGEGLEWFVQSRAALRRVRRAGTSIRGTRGTMVANPDFLAAKQSLEMAMKVLSRFGMTPSDRSQLRVPSSRKSDADRLLS